MNLRNLLSNRAFSPYRRLVFGLVRMSFFFILIANREVFTNVFHSIFEFIGFGENGVIGWSSFLLLVILVWTFYVLCVGGLHVISWKVGPLPTFDKNYFTWYGGGMSQRGAYSNIHRIMDYRDAKINHMDREIGRASCRERV